MASEVVEATGLLICTILLILLVFFVWNMSTNWKPHLHHFRIIAVLTYYAVGIIFGNCEHHEDEEWSVMDSIYYTTVTVTTVGYGDLYPLSDAGKIFSCFFILVGLSLIADALGAGIDFLVEQQDQMFKSVMNQTQEDAAATIKASAETLGTMTVEITNAVDGQSQGAGEDGITFVKEIFAKYDDDQSNELDKVELKNALSDLQVSLTQDEFDMLWPIIDADGSGAVDCEEFLELCLAEDPKGKAEKAYAQAKAEQAVKEMARGHTKTVYWAIFQFFFLIFLGTLVISLNEPDFDAVDGIYWSVVTITTVGYGDLDLTKASSRDFATFYILASVSIMGRNLGLISAIMMDRKAAATRKKLLDKPLDPALFGEDEIDNGEFLMKMLVAEDIVSEDVCNVYLEKFKVLDESGDGKLSKEDLMGAMGT